MVDFAAVTYVISMGIVIMFQLALALGAPWGAASMGGKYPGKYPLKMRIVAVINMLILGIFSMMVLIHSDFLLPQFRAITNIGIWIVVVFSAISMVLNSITPSKIERIWVPVTMIHLITSIMVAFK